MRPVSAWVLFVALGCRAEAADTTPPTQDASPADDATAAVSTDSPELAQDGSEPSASGSTPPAASGSWVVAAPEKEGADPPQDSEAAGDAAAEPEPARTAAKEQPPPKKGPAAKDEKKKDEKEKKQKKAKRPLPKPIYSQVDASCGKDTAAGTKLKAFKLETVDGKEISNRSYGRRILLVNFWGTWCKPCLKELPEFDRLYRRYRKHGLTLVAIATDEDPAPVKDFAAKRRLAAKLLVGGEDYAGKYGAAQFPFTFVVDPDGTIVSSYVGYKPKCMGKLEADIRDRIEAHRR